MKPAKSAQHEHVAYGNRSDKKEYSCERHNAISTKMPADRIVRTMKK
jgi:hypothetical protein